MNDDVLVTLPQIVEAFKVSPGAVRAWIAKGKLKPVRREGQGRSGMMYFARGDVSNLVYTICQVCGNGFKKTSLKQRFCTQVCRQRYNRALPKKDKVNE